MLSRVVFTLATLLPALLTGHSVAGDTCPEEVVLRTSHAKQGSEDSTEVIIELSAIDLNKIKAFENLAISEDNTFLSVSADAIADMASKTLDAVEHQKVAVGKLHLDTKKATLLNYTLNMETGIMSLTYDETVDYTRFAGEKLVLHKASNVGANAVEGVGSHRLRPGTTSTVDNTTIDFTLDPLDVHKLKLDTTLATQEADTYLEAALDSIADQSGQSLFAITASAAKQAAKLVPDTKKPELDSFEFNVNTATMILTFNEPVKAGTFELDSVRLTNAVTNPSASVPLVANGATVSSINGLTITIADIATKQMNDIKAATNLGTTQANTVISLLEDTVRDMNDQVIDAVAKVAKATPQPDIRHPTLTGFIFSLDEGGSAKLSFSESINVGSLTPEAITLQSAKTSEGLHKEVGLSVDAVKDSSDVNGPSITVRFSVEDGDEIKRKEFCTHPSNCFVRLDAEAITDMAFPVGKAITALGDGSAFPADEVKGDSTNPTLVEVSEVTKEGKITLVFDEPIPPAGFDYNDGALTLYAGKPTDFINEAGATLVLSGGTTESETGKTLIIQMLPDDVDSFKAKEICTFANGQNCYLQFKSSFAKDIFLNPLTAPDIVKLKPVPSTGLARVAAAVSVVLDTTPPVIETYTLDLKANFLRITFDEPVQVNVFTSSTTTVQASATDCTASKYLLDQNDNGLKQEADSRVVNLPLQVPDQVAIKALTDLGTKISNTFVSMKAGTIQDLAGNPNRVVACDAATPADGFIADATEPSFRTFAIANPNTGSIRLKFNEPVDKTNLDCSKLTLQRNEEGSEKAIVLKTPEQSQVTYVDETTKMDIDIIIVDADREKAGLDTGLFTKAADTYLKVEGGAITDMAGNLLQALFAPEKVDQFLERDPAVLEDFTLDMNNGTIILTFSAVVKVSTFAPEKMTLQAKAVRSSAGTHYVTLEDSETIGSSGSTVTIKLGPEDLNEITADRGLATLSDRSDSWLSFDADMILDNFDDIITPAPETSGKKATKYTPDTTPPAIDSYDVSLDPGFLKLTYTEQVDINEWAPHGLLIQSAEADDTVSVPLSGGSVKETDTSTIITYTFSTDNLNDLKFKDLATTPENTWLVAKANNIADMAGIGLEVIPNSAAKKANKVSVDSIPPTLERYELDMELETLTLTFSEAVLVASLEQARLTLRDGAPGTSGVQLSGIAAANTQVSPTVLQIALNLVDMNKLKADGKVARGEGSTFLACEASAVTDASSVGIAAIADGSAKKAGKYDRDNTRPVLNSFEFNVDAKTITLKFSETVNVNPFKVDAVLVQKTSKASEHTVGDGKCQLTTTSKVQTVTKNSDTVVIDVSAGDINAIKLDQELVVGESSTWISFPATAVSDVDGKTVVAVDAEDAKQVKAGKLNADATGPVLQSFTIDLMSEELALVFDEPVNADELDGKKLTLSASPSSDEVPSPVSHELEGGFPSGSTDGLTATLNIMGLDVNAIKKLEALGTGDHNTWISMKAGAATDLASQTSLELPLSNAKKSADHNPDMTAPTATVLSMDMLKGTFKLNFSETIDISSIVYNKFFFQSASLISDPLEIHGLQGGSLISTEDGTEVEVQMEPRDMNALKTKSIANVQTRAHLTILSGAIFDMNSRPVNVVANGLALNADPHIKDNANPSIVKVVSLSMHTGLLTLSFDETVRRSTLEPDKLYIQNRANTVKNCPPKTCLNNEFVASAPSVPNEAGTAQFTVDTDCQACAECNIGSYETSECSASTDSVCAACEVCPEGKYLTTFCSGDSATACDDCDANCKDCYGQDNHCQECKPNYSLMTDGTPTAGKCFKSDKSEFGEGPYELYTPSVYDDNNGRFHACHPSCTACSGPDANQCEQLNGRECHSPFVLVGVTCADACDAHAVENNLPGQYTHTENNGEGQTSTCAACDVSCGRCSGPGPEDCIECTGGDYMLFNVYVRSCIPKNHAGKTCPVGYRDSVVRRDGVDYNTCVACPKHCDECTESGCTKCASEYQRQELVGSAFALRFFSLHTYHVCADATEASEKARLTAGADPQVRYLADGSGTKSTGNGASRSDQTCELISDTDESFLLTTHPVDAASGSSSANGVEIVIALSPGDLNALKADTGLATVAANTFIAFDAAFIDDMASNDVVARSPVPVCPSPCFGRCECPINSQEAVLVIPDKIRPTLVSFDLDMDGDGKLTLVFSETVNQTSFNPEHMQLQVGDADVSSTMVIKGSLFNWPKHTTVEIVPTTDEMNALKAKRALAIDAASTWLSFTSDTVKDMNNNDIHAKPFNAAQQVRLEAGGYTPDTTKPQLVSFDFNAHTKEVKLVFSETIDHGTLNSDGLRFQDAATASASVPVNGEDSKSNTDSTVATITLTDANMHAIKVKYGTPMAQDDTDTFLQMLESFVSDTAKIANAVVPLSSGFGMKVRTGGYTPDTGHPAIDTYDLNMHLNQLHIVFTETVNLAAFDETKLVFHASGATPYRLTDSATWTKNPPAKEVVITLSRTDMNALKQNSNLAFSDASTNLVITAAAIADMAGNPIVKIDAPGKNVEFYTRDTNKPKVESFTMNMLTKQLVLSFSETVDVAQLDEAKITLQQKVTADEGTEYTLTADSVAAGFINVDGDQELHIAVITLGDFDMNSIKATENLAVAGEEIYITILADAVRDTFDQPSMAINDGFALKITDNTFVADDASPTLSGFDLNMNTVTAKLSLTFSETVRASTLRKDAFTLVTSRTANTGNNMFTLNLPDPSSSSALNVLNFNLSTSDMNQIKARTSLATDGSADSCDTFIWVKDYGNGEHPAIRDMDGNPIVPIAAGAAIQVSTYVPDSTDPELVSFSAQMVLGAPPVLLKLVFNEPVKVGNAMDVSGFALQPDKNGAGSGAVSLSALSSSTISRDVDLVTVDILVGDSDLAAIRGKANVGRSAGVTFASILAKFATDEAGNSIKGVPTSDATPVDVSTFTVDIVPPTLDNFKLDMATQELTLSFSEIVARGTLQLGTFYLQATETSDADKVVITSSGVAGTFGANNGKDVVIRLEQTKTDEIKANGNLALAKDSTWLVIAAGAIEDSAENINIAIETSAAKEAFAYQVDNIPPTLKSFRFNMQTGTFFMVFSEVMDVNQFDLTKMIIQNTNANPTLETLALAGDVRDKANAADSTIVTLDLTPDSANTARAIANLATSAADTFVRFTSGFAKDVGGVPIKATGSDAAKGCDTSTDPLGYTSDAEPPTAVSFEIDFTSADFSNMITLHFTQPVDSATIEPRNIRLQYSPDTKGPTNDTYRTLSDGQASGGLTTAVKISLREADVNEIKRLTLCRSASHCFLHFGADFGDDSEANALLALGEGSSVSLKQNGYKADNIRPYIITKGFTKMNLNTGRMTFSFSETVDRGEFDATKITLRNHFMNELAESSIRLDVTTMVSVVDGTSLMVDLTKDDLNDIKADLDLCISPSTCYLIADAGAVDDMEGNPATATVNDNGDLWTFNSFAQTVIRDGEGPILESFDLDVDKNKLTLYFDETINHNTFEFDAITLQGGANQGSKSHKLEGGDPVFPAEGKFKTSLTVNLLSTDVLKLKALEICRTAGETYLSATSNMIADMNQKPSANLMQVVQQSNAMPANADTFVGDATKPLLLAYTLNLDSGTLVLSFNEPVDSTKTYPELFTLQSDNTATPGFSLKLADAPISESPKTATSTITITLKESDISAIKLNSTVGTSVENTYLAFENAATADTQGQTILSLAGATARKADTHIEDSSLATLQSFDVNLELRTLTLSFDEIMDPTTLVPSAITIRASKNSDAEPFFPLDTSTTSSDPGKVVVIDLSNADFLGLSLKANLCTVKADTWLTMTVSALKDAFKRDVLGVNIARAFNAANFTADTFAPVIVDSVLDMAKGELGLTFTEAVNKALFAFTDIRLQHVKDLDALGETAPPAIPLGTADLTTWAIDYRSVVVKLNDGNLDAIKKRADLGTETANTYLVFSNLISDFAPTPNAIVASTSSAATQIKRHVADNIKPKLESYGVNMDTGVFSLHFDETMQAETINMTKFLFQGVKDLTATDSSGP